MQGLLPLGILSNFSPFLTKMQGLALWAFNQFQPNFDKNARLYITPRDFIKFQPILTKMKDLPLWDFNKFQPFLPILDKNAPYNFIKFQPICDKNCN